MTSKIKINQDSIKTYDKIERLKLKDGMNVFRILPPHGDPETHNNYPYKRWSIAWLDDPRSGKRRPYGSPMTAGGEAKCPINDFNKALSAFIDKTKLTLIHSGASEKEIKENLELLAKAQWNLKTNHVYAYNVATKDGKVALLEAKSTVHKALKKLMGEYIQTYGQDPTALSSDVADNAGVWFCVERTGENRDTEYSISFNQIKTRQPSGKISKEDDQTPLSPNIEENYEKLAYDLFSIYKVFTYEELKAVLLINLEKMAKDEPRLATIPGFEVGVEEAEEVEVAPVAKTTKPTAKVALALDDEDLDDEEPPFDVTPVAVPVKAKTGTSAKSIADLILE